MSSATTSGPTPSERLQGLARYPAVERSGHDSVLRLDSNEGPAPPSRLWRALTPDRVELHRYPDGSALTRRLAARHGVEPDRVIVTAGVDDALDRLCRAVLGPGRRLVLPEPTFEMIGRYARLAGAEVVSVPWSGGEWPAARVLSSIDGSTAAVAVVTPNNPTGAIVDADRIRTAAAAAPRVLWIVDLAYVEFADTDPTDGLLELDQVVVLRTLSKACGLAGARVGYAVARPEVIDWLATVGQPYAVAAPSLALAETWLDDGGPEIVRAYVERVRDERRRLSVLLRSLGADVAPSQANFVLARMEAAIRVRDRLAARGIAVRGWPRRPDLADAIRITCPGDPEPFERLCSALRRTVLEIRP